MRYFAGVLLLTACAPSPAPKAAQPEIHVPPPASASARGTASPAPLPVHAASPASQAAPSRPGGRDAGQSCGGIAGLMCKPGLRCVGTPFCDPHHGGRDCGGVCRPAQSDAGAPAH